MSAWLLLNVSTVNVYASLFLHFYEWNQCLISSQYYFISAAGVCDLCNSQAWWQDKAVAGAINA